MLFGEDLILFHPCWARPPLPYADASAFGLFQRYTQICGQHFHASVLDFLPGNMRSLDDKAASGSPSGRGDMGESGW